MMKSQQFVPENSAVLSSAGCASRKSGIALAMSIVFSLTLLTCVAAENPQHEHAMDMNMDMSMDHSMHEHHMAVKPGLVSRSVSTITVPDVKLVDMKGKEIALRELLDGRSPLILNFIFTTCTTICPVQSATFRQVQKQLDSRHSEAHQISISIDPENDTPPKLGEYAKKFSAGPRWKLLTGSLENSIAVQKAFGVFAGDKMDQKPVVFVKAKGSDNSWVRLDGLVGAPDILKEFDKLDAK